jgi:hypothetical protein
MAQDAENPLIGEAFAIFRLFLDFRRRPSPVNWVGIGVAAFEANHGDVF